MGVNNKYNVTLVRGPIVFKDGAVNNEATPSIAYAYLSSYLKNKGYKVVIVDAIKEGLNKIWPVKSKPGYSCHGATIEDVIDRIPKNAEVIGFSAMFSGEWPVLRSLILHIREYFPKALFVAGGEHVTALTEYCLRDCPALDVCVRGEGERTFYQLLEEYLQTGTFSKTQGVGYLDESGCYRQNGDKTPRINNIDDLPWPDWPDGYLEAFWREGKSYGIGTQRDMPFIISRGCPYQCTFCSNREMWANRYVIRNVDDVIKEIKHYINKYNITSVQLYDLTAIIKKSWIVDFCNRLISEKIRISWSMPSGTRSEALDAETLALLKETGCNYIVYAPECGSQRMLKLIKKQISLKNVTASMLEAKRKGLAIRTNLIIGFPRERWSDLFQTLLYGLYMSMRGADEVPLFIFSSYPGSEIFKTLMKEGRIKLGDDYFYSLASLNSSYLSINMVPWNSNLKSCVISVIRTGFILANYIIGYLLYPHRLLRTLRVLRENSESATVFEHRLKDMLRKRKVSNNLMAGWKIVEI